MFFSKDRQSPVTAARVRLMLDPGQIAGLDSEEGGSVNIEARMPKNSPNRHHEPREVERFAEKHGRST